MAEEDNARPTEEPQPRHRRAELIDEEDVVRTRTTGCDLQQEDDDERELAEDGAENDEAAAERARDGPAAKHTNVQRACSGEWERASRADRPSRVSSKQRLGS